MPVSCACEGFGARTWARGRICMRCREYARDRAYQAHHGLHGGHWVPDHGVLRWIEDEPSGRLPLTLGADERRAAHARYWHGERDLATVRGEREYQRARKRVQRRVA